MFLKRKNCSLEIKPAARRFVPHRHYGNNIISECALSLSAKDWTEINFQHFTNELMSLRWAGFCWWGQIKAALIMEMISAPHVVILQLSSNNFLHNLFNHVCLAC